MTNRNTIIGFLLIFAILIGYYLITAPSKEELAQQRWQADSLARAKYYQDSLLLARQTLESKEAAAQPAPMHEDSHEAAGASGWQAAYEQFGVFASASQGADETYFLENDLLKIGIASKGGKIVYAELKEYKTWDQQPLLLIESDTSAFGFTFFAGNRVINTDNFYFQPFWLDPSLKEKKLVAISGQEQGSLAMRLYVSRDSIPDQSSYIEYLFTIKGDNYMLDFDVNFVNMNGIVDVTRGFIDFEWGADLRKQEKIIDRFNGTTIYYKILEEKVHNLSENKDEEEALRDKVNWISFKQQFFATTLISDKAFADPIMRVSTTENHPDHRYNRSVYFKVGVPMSGGQSETIPMSLYFGPNKYNILRKYKADLERQIPLGWSFFLLQWINRFAVLPVFNYLGSFGWNYGIVILVLTILLKIVLFPIAYKTYLSSAKMRVLKPEVDEINGKYPKREDAMKKQQALMALYKKAGVNPMSGCIPILLQMPILIAMFRFFPASIELRQQAFLWANDLSSYDSVLNLPFTIPFYGDHVSLFTLLMTISTVIYTYMNNQMMGSTSQQMPGMKTMMYIMPIMFLPMFNSYSSGLSYYYLLVNLLTFAQMYTFRFFVDEDKIHRQIEENKAKPVKKSSFQKRLEDAAKKRGYNPSRR